MDVAHRIIRFIQEDLLDGRNGLKPETRLFSTSRLDSLDLVELVSFIEEEFDVKVGSADITVNNLDSPALIEALVRSKLEAGRAA
jgi:acyl carrier protein